MQDWLSALHAFYGPLPAPPDDPFQFVVWEIVSAKALAQAGMHPFQVVFFRNLFALLILSPVFHRVMHQLHLPDQEDPDEGKPKPKPKPKPSRPKP